MPKTSKPSGQAATGEQPRAEAAIVADEPKVEGAGDAAAPAAEGEAAPAADPAAPTDGVGLTIVDKRSDTAAPIVATLATGGVAGNEIKVLVGEAGSEAILPRAVVTGIEGAAAHLRDADGAKVVVPDGGPAASATANVITFDPPAAASRGARERARASTGAPRYAVRALADGEAEIQIYDEIGWWGITARQFLNDLRALGSVNKITVCINSPGGDVFDGIAIHNALRNHAAEITVRVDGLAASIASVIAMAGDKVVMPSNAMMMIHDPWTIAMGNGDDMRKVADALDKMADALVSSYVGKSGMKPDRVREMMREETWLTAAEAVALGLADEIQGPVKAAAHFDLSAFRHAPSALLPPAAKPSAHEDATARATEIIDLCAIAKLPHMARDLIASGVSIDVARARLTNAKASGGGAEIDNRNPPTTKNSPAPGNGGQPAGASMTAEIYEARRRFGQPANNRKEA